MKKRTPTALLLDDDIRVEAYVELLRTYEALSARFRETFKGRSLTLQQYNVLRILYVRDQGGNGLSCQEIGQRLIHRVPDITRLLDRLEATGWIERERSSEDRRVVLTHLTEAGLAKVEEVHPALMATHHEVFAHMEDRDVKRLRSLLRKARGPPP